MGNSAPIFKYFFSNELQYMLTFRIAKILRKIIESAANRGVFQLFFLEVHLFLFPVLLALTSIESQETSRSKIMKKFSFPCSRTNGENLSESGSL